MLFPRPTQHQLTLLLQDHKRKAVCLYTSPEPEQKSNLAVIAALYSVRYLPLLLPTTKRPNADTHTRSLLSSTMTPGTRSNPLLILNSFRFETLATASTSMV